MAEDFSWFLVKEYLHWSIFVHENQGYLGRCVVWCKREDALDLADASQEEREELFVVLHDLREAAKKAFQPNWFNYAFLGNETRHLHGHFLPRYSRSVEFMGVVFEDKLWGHNYQTDHSFKVSSEVIQGVKEQLMRHL